MENQQTKQQRVFVLDHKVRGALCLDPDKMPYCINCIQEEVISIQILP